MHLFYTPDINSNTYSLNEAESKHCIKVLRLSIDDIIYLIDGKGSFHTAKIIDAYPKKCTVEITNTIKEYDKRDFHLHIAIAPTKNTDRFEWFLEKATEIGIDEITPLLCQRSERKTIKPERLNKVITSAVKQSIKAYHPKLNEFTKFKDFISLNYIGDKYIAHCEELDKKSLKREYSQKNGVLILIGPEGDFSPEEIDLAIKNNFTPVSLGNSRLRTETAGVVACHTINLLNEK